MTMHKNSVPYKHSQRLNTWDYLMTMYKKSVLYKHIQSVSDRILTSTLWQYTTTVSCKDTVSVWILEISLWQCTTRGTGGPVPLHWHAQIWSFNKISLAIQIPSHKSICKYRCWSNDKIFIITATVRKFF